MHQISFEELKIWQSEERDFLLIDVREPFEHEHFNIGGQNIPLAEIASKSKAFSKEKNLVIYCAKGIRSVIAIQKLADKGFENLYNLSGGIDKVKNRF